MDHTIERIIIAAMIVGILLWQYETVYGIFIVIKCKFVKRRTLKELVGPIDIRRTGILDKKIWMLIEGAEANNIFVEESYFYMCSIVIFLGAIFIGFTIFGPHKAIICGLLFGSCPYLFLLVRLKRRRVDRSKEGDILVQEILNNYRICNYNMKDAISETVDSLEKTVVGKSLIINLSKGLQNAVTEDDTKSVLSQFKYGIDTSWGNILATNIFFAHIYGIRVDSALQDLLKGINNSKNISTHSIRENNESRLILNYLAPFTYLMSIWCGCKFFNFTVLKFLKYQFGTSVGIKWFIIVCITYLAGMVIKGLFSEERMDL